MITNPPSLVTQGSVAFAGVGGVFSEQNTKFFWDDTNFRLGLGNGAPTTTLDVTGDTKITGNLTQLTGAISLTGNVASSITTSAGALTLTSAAAATWRTSAGALTLDSNGAALNLGTIDASTVIIGRSIHTTQINGFLVTDSISPISSALAIDGPTLQIGNANATFIVIGGTGVASQPGAIQLTNAGMIYYSNVPNGASALAHNFDVSTTFSTAGAKLLNVMNNAVEKFAINLNGDVTSRRRIATGTVPVAGDFALGAGWGTTAAVSSITGNDSALQFTITANGTGRATLATCTYTFKNGTFTTAPKVMIAQNGASSNADLTDGISWTVTATTFVLTYIPLPGAATTHTFTALIEGTA